MESVQLLTRRGEHAQPSQRPEDADQRSGTNRRLGRASLETIGSRAHVTDHAVMGGEEPL